MKRIPITHKIQRIAEQYRDNLKLEFIQPTKKLEDFRDSILCLINHGDASLQKYVDYINAIINNYDEIITLPPNKFDKYKDDVFFMLKEDDLKRVIKDKKFHEAIVSYMRYEDARNTVIRKYFDKLGIKTCVYCNAQYAITIPEGSKLRANYEIDHFKPTSKYPFLCISFFNMQPSCPCCNRQKNNNEAKFNLYAETKEELNPFIFSLEPSSIIKYMLGQNKENLIIELNSNNKDLILNHNKLFHIDLFYQAFKDEAEELLWKCKTRNDTYIDVLIKTFENQFPCKKNEIKRFLYGFYNQEIDIHKRPMTKLKQDIANQLKL